MNIKELADRLELEEEEFRELLELYLENGKNELIALKRSIQENNVEKVIDIAHSFKGASANLGFTKLQQTAEHIEHSARDNRVDGLVERFYVLENMFEDLKNLL